MIIFLTASLPAISQVKENLQRYSPHEVLKAIIHVESRDGEFTYNRDEPEAVGILQMFPIYVDDVNRIVGYRKYKYSDRNIRSEAIEMFWIYQRHYNPSGDIEKMIRIHCGGPDGFEQTGTLPYLELVKKQLNN